MTEKRNTALPARELLASAVLGAAGVLIAYGAIYAGIGVNDGFGDWDLHRTGRQLRRMLVWLIPVAAIGAVYLRDSYHRMAEKRPRGWEMFHAVARLLVLFGLWGMSMIIGLTVAFIVLPFRWLAARLRRDPKPVGFSSFWTAVPGWYFGFPMELAGFPLKDDDDQKVELISVGALSTQRLLLWLPCLLTGIWFWTGATSEDTGERVDPRWLFAFASYWFADFFLVAYQVLPALKARRPS